MMKNIKLSMIILALIGAFFIVSCEKEFDKPAVQDEYTATTNPNAGLKYSTYTLDLGDYYTFTSVPGWAGALNDGDLSYNGWVNKVGSETGSLEYQCENPVYTWINDAMKISLEYPHGDQDSIYFWIYDNTESSLGYHYLRIGIYNVTSGITTFIQPYINGDYTITNPTQQWNKVVVPWGWALGDEDLSGDEIYMTIHLGTSSDWQFFIDGFGYNNNDGVTPKSQSCTVSGPGLAYVSQANLNAYTATFTADCSGYDDYRWSIYSGNGTIVGSSTGSSVVVDFDSYGGNQVSLEVKEYSWQQWSNPTLKAHTVYPQF